jgi:hypothetical protein
MANEAEIINNPDSTPGAVSTGYQLQNTNLVSQRTGIDKTYVSGGAGTVTVEISGPVDVNGVMYDIKSQTVLTPPSAGRYYITLQGAGPQYLTPTLSEVTAGYAYWSALKNAYYTVGDEYRVLDWLVDFDGTDCRVYRRGIDKIIIWITSTSTFISPWSQFYDFELCGKGGNGGTSFWDGASTFMSGGGGGAAAWGWAREKFISAGISLSATLSSTSGGNTSITDGSTITLSVQNGYNGANGSSGGAGGNFGSSSSGLDKAVSGYNPGSNGTTSAGGAGANLQCLLQYYGGYGYGGSGGDKSVGGNSPNYGAGGGGGGLVFVYPNYITCSGGLGGSGFIKIIM